MSSITELMPFIVLIPLIAGPICALLPGRALPWLLTTASMATAFVLSALTLAAVFDGGTLSYAFGNWAPPVGIEYRVDAANAFVALLITGVASVLLPWGRPIVDAEVPERQGSFYALLLIAVAGLLGITLTGDVGPITLDGQFSQQDPHRIPSMTTAGLLLLALLLGCAGWLCRRAQHA